MTSEIAVMNRSAVAIAADSAATLETERVHKIYMTNKLFALSENHPVGIMIYGKPELLDVPWETIIEMYRRHLKGNSFGTLTEYLDKLVKFIESAKDLFPEQVQKDFFQQSLHLYYLYCLVFQSNVSDYDEELSRGMVPMERISHGSAI